MLTLNKECGMSDIFGYRCCCRHLQPERWPTICSFGGKRSHRVKGKENAQENSIHIMYLFDYISQE
jgi:hypothetical protein